MALEYSTIAFICILDFCSHGTVPSIIKHSRSNSLFMLVMPCFGTMKTSGHRDDFVYFFISSFLAAKVACPSYHWARVHHRATHCSGHPQSLGLELSRAATFSYIYIGIHVFLTNIHFVFDGSKKGTTKLNQRHVYHRVHIYTLKL